jgi:signal transduction histidine kinase
VDVQVDSDHGLTEVRVRDDGRGGAELARGSGLVGLMDRVEALGGRLSLHSPRGAGTTVQVLLPLTAPSAHAVELTAFSTDAGDARAARGRTPESVPPAEGPAP